MAGGHAFDAESARGRTTETGGMGTILEFRLRAKPAIAAEAPDDGRLGEVIIFPGVRIERRTDEEPAGLVTPRKRASRGRKRQRR